MMSNTLNEKIFRDIAILLAVSITITAILRIFFDFNLKEKQIILRKVDLNRFDRCAIITPDNKKLSDLILAGLPGDTIWIVNSEPFVNSRNISRHFFSLFMIDLSANDEKLSLKQYPVTFTFMSFADYHRLKKQLLIRPVSLPRYTPDTSVYPHSPRIPWNKDNYGKFILPHKGLKLKLNRYTYLLYAPLIKKYEHTEIIQNGKHFFINGKKTDIYTFRKDYYFLLSRNLSQANDCRTWGPLPRNRIIGKIITMPQWTDMLIKHILLYNRSVENFINQH